MKNKFFSAALSGIVLSASCLVSTANAGLIDRGNGLIYDDVQDITWLQDANYAQTSSYDTDGQMTWEESKSWATNLSFGGFDDWRLFNAAPDDVTCSNNTQPSGFDSNGDVWSVQYYGHNCTLNELGHLFYNDFNLTSGQSISTISGSAEFDLFINIQNSKYWSDTEIASNTINAWYFDTYNGSQGGTVKSSNVYAWAVRDGDVGAVTSSVPEPSTLAIFGLGLLGLIARKRQG